MWIELHMSRSGNPVTINVQHIVGIYQGFDGDGDEDGSYVEVTNSSVKFRVNESYGEITMRLGT